MVAQTYTNPLPLELVTIPYSPEGTLDLDALEKSMDERVSSVRDPAPQLFRLPGRPRTDRRNRPRSRGALYRGGRGTLIFGPSWKPPGLMGADIVVGEGQSFGNPVNFGGPYIGFFATKEAFLRSMPGEAGGETVTWRAAGASSWRLPPGSSTSGGEKATSNICTNQALCALAVPRIPDPHGETGPEETGGKRI